MSRSIVIVDDSEYVTKGFKIFLEEKMGFNVVGVGHNGNEAVELYSKLQPDIITLDISMPLKDGYQALKDIISKFPDANIIMITAVKGVTLTDCLKEGAKGFLEKPMHFNNEDFINKAQTLFNEILGEDK